MIGGKIYLLTSFGADRRRLMVADVANPARENWKELIPEGEGVLKSVQLSGDNMYLTYEKDASDHVSIYSMDGKKVSDVNLPGIGSIALSTSRKHPEDVFYNLSSFTSPSTLYSFDVSTGESTRMFQPELEGVNLDDYVTEQVFYPSADGTKVRYSIRAEARRIG